LSKGDYDKAFADYNEAIRLNPHLASAYNNRGTAWDETREYDKAVFDFNEAIKLDPKFATAYNNRGNAWHDKGEYDKAIADYSEAIKLNPRYQSPYHNRGNLWYIKNDYGRAIADFKEAVRLDPSDANAKESLQLALNKKQRQEARTASADKQKQPSRQPAPTGSGDKRVALVIGNSKYKSVTPLDNPSRDAELLAKTLRDVGFDDVMTRLNLSRAEMMTALKDFEKVAADADWAAIYYAGHGMEIGGVNYMIPIDAQITDENKVATQTVNLEYLLNSVEGAKKLRLVIVDACRNNPYAQQVRVASASRGVSGAGPSSVGNGLARVEPEPGTLVVYAAKNGEVALDGDGKNSPFAEALAKRIEQKPPIEVRRLFDFVRKDVFEITNKGQQPFAYGSLEPSEDFYFAK
jgi:lipoprotein NlpI